MRSSPRLRRTSTSPHIPVQTIPWQTDHPFATYWSFALAKRCLLNFQPVYTHYLTLPFSTLAPLSFSPKNTQKLPKNPPFYPYFPRNNSAPGLPKSCSPCTKWLKISQKLARNCLFLLSARNCSSSFCKNDPSHPVKSPFPHSRPSRSPICIPAGVLPSHMQSASQTPETVEREEINLAGMGYFRRVIISPCRHPSIRRKLPECWKGFCNKPRGCCVRYGRRKHN